MGRIAFGHKRALSSSITGDQDWSIDFIWSVNGVQTVYVAFDGVLTFFQLTWFGREKMAPHLDGCPTTGGFVMNDAILLLGSDAGIRNAIAKALEVEGYSVVPADGMGEAIDLLRKHSLDLLIVRPYLENISGHDAAIYLRRHSPGLPVLIVAGFFDDLNLETTETFEGFYTFPKPFSAVELVSKVREVLAHSSAHAETPL